jgi:hypothetical protein
MDSAVLYVCQCNGYVKLHVILGQMQKMLLDLCNITLRVFLYDLSNVLHTKKNGPKSGELGTHYSIINTLNKLIYNKQPICIKKKRCICVSCHQNTNFLLCFSRINSDYSFSVFRNSRRLVARLTQYQWVYVGFVVEKMALEQVFLKLLPFFSINYHYAIRGEGHGVE